jgi:TPR repeat protein
LNTEEIIRSLIQIREPELLFAISYLADAKIDLMSQPEKANEFLRGRAEKNDAEAQFALGRLLCIGAFGEIDRHSALELYSRASDSGYTPALVGLAHFYINGWAGLAVDKDRGVSLLKEGAKRGYAHAATYLATAYSEGILVTKDSNRSNYFLNLGAELGDADAQYLLGNQLLDGADPSKANEAEKWLQLAAENGSASAHRRLANLYSSGAPGIARNDSRAKHHHLMADEIESCFDP